MSVLLFIDTTVSSKTIVAITKNGVKKQYEEDTDSSTKSQNVLSLIEKALKMQSLKFPELTEIEVNSGPGSFTGTRVGVAVANTLGWVIGIPINGKKIAVPKYAESKFDPYQSHGLT